MDSFFFELTIVLILAGCFAFIVSLFRQPSIIAYILTGLLIGPLGYYQLHQGEVLNGLAEIGITLLLFTVGLELDITQLKRLGKTALIAGIGQILITTIAGVLLLTLLGFSATSSWYIALALTFSSTVVVVKLLTEKSDLHSLYGKIALGILMVQDLAALGILISLSATGGDTHPLFAGLALWQQLLFTLAKAFIFGLGVIWLSKKVIPIVLRYIGKSDELLLVFSLAWALGFAAFASLPLIGFGLEMGGFVAGLALANTAVHYQISARIKSLRDFFIIIFFIVLGSQLVFNNLAEITIPALILSAFIIIGSPFIVLVILSWLGYKPRTAFMSGLAIAQVSEFSFILITVAYKLGYVDQTAVSLVTLVGIITIAVSSYLILYSNHVYEFSKHLLAYFDFKKGSAEKGLHQTKLKNHVVLVGAHRLGRHIIHSLTVSKQAFVIVDHNPEISEQLQHRQLHAICGDITDSHIQELANLQHARLIISTVPDMHDNLSLIDTLKKLNTKAKLVFTAHNEEEALELYEQHVDYALLPHFIGGLHLAKILENNHNFAELKKLKKQHLALLKTEV